MNEQTWMMDAIEYRDYMEDLILSESDDDFILEDDIFEDYSSMDDDINKLVSARY